MSRFVFTSALVLGAAAIVAMALVFAGSDLLGLVITVVIGVVYGIGCVEIVRFRQATATLDAALTGLPAEAPEVSTDFLERWLARLHPSLQNAVRLRVEGERVGLPAPVVTPYLVGLLVMLGLLGTFLGMVATLQGAVFALEGTTELQAIRAGLAAPIKGLALAFGTSVAGVAASAMLGLIAVVSRRDRMAATRQLDGKVATVLRGFSLLHQRQQTFKALQEQAGALPAAGERLQALAESLAGMGERLGEQLLANQERFHQSASRSHAELAASLQHALAESVAESGRQTMANGRLLGESVRPLLQALIDDVGREAVQTQRQLAHTAEQQLSAVSHSLLESFASNSAAWLQQHGERMNALTSTLRDELQALRDEERARAQAALAQLAALGGALETPLARLLETASETPRAAAGLIAELRQELAQQLARDNALLDERQQLMARLATITDSLQQAGDGQRQALAALHDAAATALVDVAARCGERLDAQATQLSGIAESLTGNAARIADDFAGSALEMASLGEAFTLAVQLFNEANDKLVDRLDRIEQSLDRSGTRSDEQLAYYVAQARAIIDQSVRAQKEIFDELRQLRQPAAGAARQALDGAD